MKKEPSDMGTPELGRRFTIVPKFDGPFDAASSMHGKIMDGTEIDRLLFTGRVSSGEWSILTEFLRRLQKANYGTLQSPSFEGTPQGNPSIMADRRAQKLRSIVKLFKRMNRHADIGEIGRLDMIHLVMDAMVWPKAEDKRLKDMVKALQNIMLDG